LGTGDRRRQIQDSRFKIDSEFKIQDWRGKLTVAAIFPLRRLQHTRFSRILKAMEIHFTPDVEKKLNDLAAQSGRGTDELLRDAVAGYLEELAETRNTLDRRYDELKSGRVKPIDGEEAFARLKAKTEGQRNHSA